MVLPNAAQSPLARPDATLLMAKAALNIAVELLPELANSSALFGNSYYRLLNLLFYNICHMGIILLWASSYLAKGLILRI
jgi:hypothetical protein